MKRVSLILIPLVSLVVVTSCVSSRQGDVLTPRSIDLLSDPYIGSWDFIVSNTPKGDAEGVIVIERSGNDYQVNLDSELGQVDLEKIDIEDERLKGYFHYNGMRINVKGRFEGNTLEGKVGVTLASFPLSARKRASI